MQEIVQMTDSILVRMSELEHDWEGRDKKHHGQKSPLCPQVLEFWNVFDLSHHDSLLYSEETERDATLRMTQHL